MSSHRPALGTLDCTLRQLTTPTLFCPELKHFLCADISAKHYPERLGLFLVVGAPRIFSGLWHVLQPLVDPFTRQKIKFLPCVSPPQRGMTGQGRPGAVYVGDGDGWLPCWLRAAEKAP